MTIDIRWLGHSAFMLSAGADRVLIDPFLTGNPKAAVSADEVDPTHILLTHGHSDHLGDTVEIAKRTGAKTVAITEIARELEEDGVDVADPNLGGTVKFDWGWVKLVPALHTSTTPKGTASLPAGLLISFHDVVVYHVGDTALFSDLGLHARRGNPVDVALVPIGGHYTMDRWDAVAACDLIGAKHVLPCHFGTFGPIETDAGLFKADVESATSSEVFVLDPGDTHTHAA